MKIFRREALGDRYRNGAAGRNCSCAVPVLSAEYRELESSLEFCIWLWYNKKETLKKERKNR